MTLAQALAIAAAALVTSYSIAPAPIGAALPHIRDLAHLVAQRDGAPAAYTPGCEQPNKGGWL